MTTTRTVHFMHQLDDEALAAALVEVAAENCGDDLRALVSQGRALAAITAEQARRAHCYAEYDREMHR